MSSKAHCSLIFAIVRTDENQVRRVIHEFNLLGWDSLRPFVGGGRPRRLDQPTRDRIIAIARCPARGNAGR